MHCGGGGQMNGDYKYHPGRLSIATCLVITPNFCWTNHQLGLNWPPSTFICIPAYYPIPPLASCQWNQFIFIIILKDHRFAMTADGSSIWLTANCYHAKVCFKVLSIPTHSLYFVAYFLHTFCCLLTIISLFRPQLPCRRHFLPFWLLQRGQRPFSAPFEFSAVCTMIMAQPP